jgi:hypothetical protein
MDKGGALCTDRKYGVTDVTVVTSGHMKITQEFLIGFIKIMKLVFEKYRY